MKNLILFLMLMGSVGLTFGQVQIDAENNGGQIASWTGTAGSSVWHGFYPNNTYSGFIQSTTSNFDVAAFGTNLRFYSGSAYNAVLDSDGDFGIGTTAPAAKFHVVGTSGELARLTTSSTNPYISLFRNNSTSTSERVFLGSISGDARIGNGISGGGFNVYCGGSQKLTLLDSGELGIGTTNPSVEFHINGSNEMLRLQGANAWMAWYNAANTARNAYIYFWDSNNEFRFENDVNGPMTFRTNSSERMRIEGDGDISIGSSAASAKVDIFHNSSTSDAHIELSESGANDYARIKFRNTGSDYWDIAGATGTTDEFNLYFYTGTSGNNFFTIDPNLNNIEIDGDVVAADVSFDLGNNNASEHWDDCVADDFINFSDARLKKDINDLNSVLPSVLDLRPVTYQYIESHNIDKRLRTGFIAQEVQDIFPSVVVDEDVDYNWQTNEIEVKKSEYLSMNYVELIPVLTKAIQEQQELIEALEARITELENK